VTDMDSGLPYASPTGPAAPREITLVVPPAAKALLTSKTFWFNVASLLLVALGLVLDSAKVFDLTEQEIAGVTIAVAVINAAIRLWTNKPIAGSPGAAGLQREVAAKWDRNLGLR
jgi:hypothetical protein